MSSCLLEIELIACVFTGKHSNDEVDAALCLDGGYNAAAFY
jgi:hypothetical protein